MVLVWTLAELNVAGCAAGPQDNLIPGRPEDQDYLGILSLAYMAI